MQSVLYSILFYLAFFTKPLVMQINWKPSFVPFCSPREVCQSDCSCISSPNCTVLQMDDNIRAYILFSLNQIRDIQSRGEPPPAGMPLLQYNRHLEEISMCWVSKCQNLYSECFTTPHFSETSQSVGQLVLRLGETPGKLWNDILNLWLGGMEILNAEIMTSLPAGQEGIRMHNYAQMLSDRVQFVGCSWSVSMEFLTFACTYGPRGPLQGEAICRRGPPCSNCPAGYECDFQKPYNQLCKPKRTSRTEAQTSEAAPEAREGLIIPKMRPPYLPAKKRKVNKKLRVIVIVIGVVLVVSVSLMVFAFIAYYLCAL